MMCAKCIKKVKMMISTDSRVLHVIDVLTPGSGVANVVMNCVAGIPQFKQDVAIYEQCSAEMEETIEIHGGRVYRLPDITKTLGKHFRKAFSQLLQKQPYTIVHGYLLNSAFIYLQEAKRLGVPHRIIHAHSVVGADILAKRVRNSILSVGISCWANEYISVSKAAGQSVFGRNRKDVSIIRNGIDCARFRYNPEVRREVRLELGLADDVIDVGNLARFAGLKNHNFLIEVFRDMHKRTKCTLILVGQGSLEGDIKTRIKSTRLSDCVQFLGARQDVERIVSSF